MKRVLLLALFCLSAALGTSARAIDYPTKSIRFVVPFSPGTGMDRIARQVGEELRANWGQTVTVENRLGAAGHIGAQMVAQTPPDGYVVLVTASNISITATMFRSSSFDAMKDLMPLAIAAYGDSTLVANPNAKFSTLPEMIAMAKANPGKLTFATPGTGSPQHIAMSLFEQAAGIQFLHIPYKGTAPAITDTIGGQVDMTFVATHTVMPYVKSGQLKAIAVAAEKRNPFVSEIPSFGELGVNGVSTQAWYGFMLPRGTPSDVVAKLHDGIVAALEKPGIKDDLKKFGLDVRPSTPEEMARVIHDEYTRYGAIIKRNNIIAE